MNLEYRFWKKVKIGQPNECWPWQDSLPKGYGQFRYGNKMRRAHRVAWELTNGSIPKDLCVCHSCDNKSCCNPNHLFITSHAGNMHDAALKGIMKGWVHISNGSRSV